MKNPIIIAAIIMLAAFTACNTPERSDLTVEAVGKEKSKQKDAATTFNFNGAQPIDSTDYVLYPLGLTEKGDGSDVEIYKSRSGIQYYRNIIFYNMVTKKYHLLDNRKMLITSYSAENNAEAYGTTSSYDKLSRLIYYKVIVNDYNGDGKLGDGDPEYLFISDREGSYFKQISPDNLNVARWKEVRKTGKVLIEVTDDANGDKKFEQEELSIPYVYDIKSGALAAPVFSKDFTDSVGNLLEKQWIKKDK